MNKSIDFMSTARQRRLIALEALARRQPELPGFGEPQPAAATIDKNVTTLRDWAVSRPDAV